MLSHTWFNYGMDMHAGSSSASGSSGDSYDVATTQVLNWNTVNMLFFRHSKGHKNIQKIGQSEKLNACLLLPPMSQIATDTSEMTVKACDHLFVSVLVMGWETTG